QANSMVPVAPGSDANSGSDALASLVPWKVQPVGRVSRKPSAVTPVSHVLDRVTVTSTGEPGTVHPSTERAIKIQGVVAGGHTDQTRKILQRAPAVKSCREFMLLQTTADIRALPGCP